MDQLKSGRGIRNIADCDGMKTCCMCNQSIHISAFKKDGDRHDGLSSKCKSCANTWHREYRRLNPGLREKYKPSIKDPRSSYLRAKYKMTRTQYDEMLSSQGGGCAICGSNKPGGRGLFHVDHCHKTGVVRGILCASCNLSLGMMKDSADFLRRAIAYLERQR